MNVQACNGQFVLAYLVSYVASEEERSVVALSQRDSTSAQASVIDLKKRKRTTGGTKETRSVGALIVVPEMLFHLLGLMTIRQSFGIMHVASGPPDEQFFFLDDKHKPGHQ